MTVRRELLAARAWREERDVREAQGRSLPVPLVTPLSPVSRESSVGDCSRSAHEQCGLTQ